MLARVVVYPQIPCKSSLEIRKYDALRFLFRSMCLLTALSTSGDGVLSPIPVEIFQVLAEPGLVCMLITLCGNFALG